MKKNVLFLTSVALCVFTIFSTLVFAEDISSETTFSPPSGTDSTVSNNHVIKSESFGSSFDLSPFLSTPNREAIKQSAESMVASEAVIPQTANTPILGYKLTWNIANIYYWLDSSCVNYNDLISNAASNWVNTGYGWNNLYPATKTTNISASAIDIYEINTYSDGSTLAYTTFFKRQNGTTGAAIGVNPSAENWLFNEIHLVRSTLNSLSRGDRQATIAHEIGHCWGLAHYNSNPNSIMCQFGSGRAVVFVQECDHNAFKSLYG